MYIRNQNCERGKQESVRRERKNEVGFCVQASVRAKVRARGLRHAVCECACVHVCVCVCVYIYIFMCV